MKLELAMTREGHHLVPASEWDLGAMQAITKRIVMVTIHQDRNAEHHKKFWAKAGLVSDHCDQFSCAEDAVEWAKLQEPSMRKEYVFADGKVVMSVKSLSFAAMDQVEFNQFYDQTMKRWSMLVGCDVETLTKGGDGA